MQVLDSKVTSIALNLNSKDWTISIWISFLFTFAASSTDQTNKQDVSIDTKEINATNLKPSSDRIPSNSDTVSVCKCLSK